MPMHAPNTYCGLKLTSWLAVCSVVPWIALAYEMNGCVGTWDRAGTSGCVFWAGFRGPVPLLRLMSVLLHVEKGRDQERCPNQSTQRSPSAHEAAVKLVVPCRSHVMQRSYGKGVPFPLKAHVCKPIFFPRYFFIIVVKGFRLKLCL